MIPSSPFFRPPYYYPNKDYYYNTYNHRLDLNSEAHSTDTTQMNGKKDETTNETSRNIDKSSKNIIEFFGLKLQFDDLLLIGLIFFLYNEEVQDTLLFMALILLLLS